MGLFLLIMLFGVFIFTRHDMREYRKWQNFIDINFPFMTDEEARQYISKLL